METVYYKDKDLYNLLVEHRCFVVYNNDPLEDLKVVLPRLYNVIHRPAKVTEKVRNETIKDAKKVHGSFKPSTDTAFYLWDCLLHKLAREVPFLKEDWDKGFYIGNF